MRIAVEDGVELAATVAGRVGAPGLVLVHGYGGAKEDFGDHLDRLATDHRVVAFDHRGHGASDRPADAAVYSLDRLVADTLAVADALELGRFRLLGHSMGGMVARRLVLSRPERVEALVLMDTSPGPVPGLTPQMARGQAHIVLDRGMDALRRILDELDPLGNEAHRRLVEERPGYTEFLERKWDALSPVMYGQLGIAISEQPDDTEALREVACPTLVIVGELDQLFLEPSRLLADAIPGAWLAVVPGAGHSPQFENDVAWWDALAGFLAGLPAVTERVRR